MAGPYDDDLALALRMADRADEMTLAAFRSEDLVIDTKPDLTPVTEADRGVERMVREMLAQERPEDPVVGEEYGGADEGGRRWIVDPIDGTKNFVRGVPVWATLIALAIDDEVVVGVVAAPALGRRWWAAKGSGAWTRGPEDSADRRCRVSAVSSLADASFSFSDGVGWLPGTLEQMMGSVWRTRGYGDFWSHMLVAEGHVDLAAEPELDIWDLAALVAVVEEAGGTITAFTGDGGILSGAGAITTNGHLHDAASRIIRPT
ncbi:MAG: histidinol phosphatase [Actinomycetales bacterium]|nr:histidinol phosphatase [Actinomycetales bacterium]